MTEIGVAEDVTIEFHVSRMLLWALVTKEYTLETQVVHDRLRDSYQGCFYLVTTDNHHELLASTEALEREKDAEWVITQLRAMFNPRV